MNILIAGSARAGKSTLARIINDELNYFVLGLDKLVATFHSAYPQLDIRLAWNRKKVTNNIAPFLGHFLGMFSAFDGRGLLPYSHGAAPGNKFVMEGAYFNFNEVLSALKAYGIEELEDKFILIGLVQNTKTVDEFISDFNKYDTEDDWTYGFSDNELREIAENEISFAKYITDYLMKYGFVIYDTSTEREQVFEQVMEDIKLKLLNS
jgi:hypothetical protein